MKVSHLNEALFHTFFREAPKYLRGENAKVKEAKSYLRNLLAC